MLRATREARCDLPACSEPKGWPTAPTAPGGLDLVLQQNASVGISKPLPTIFEIHRYKLISDPKLSQNRKYKSYIKIFDEKSSDEKKICRLKQHFQKLTPSEVCTSWVPVAAEMEPDVHL